MAQKAKELPVDNLAFQMRTEQGESRRIVRLAKAVAQAQDDWLKEAGREFEEVMKRSQPDRKQYECDWELYALAVSREFVAQAGSLGEGRRQAYRSYKRAQKNFEEVLKKP